MGPFKELLLALTFPVHPHKPSLAPSFVSPHLHVQDLTPSAFKSQQMA
jgi:hypothetical protein